MSTRMACEALFYSAGVAAASESTYTNELQPRQTWLWLVATLRALYSIMAKHESLGI